MQKELETRELDTAGKKTELVDRLWDALQKEKGKSVEMKPEVKADESQVLLARLKIIKEREALAEREIELKAHVEKEQLRIKARSEQLDLELKLAEMGHQVQEEASLERVQVHPDASVQDKSCNVSDVLAAHVQKVLLPPTELSPFTGDVQSYRLFVKAFEARIISRTQDKSELLYYLAQFTKGKPHQIVRSCLSLGEKGYDEARRLLEERYGSAYCLVDSYVDRLKLWPRILPGDVEGLDRLALFLVEVQNAMSSVPKGELEQPRTLREVVQKLPASLRDRWMREADRKMEQQKGAAGSVEFKDLVGFLKKEVRILKNQVFGAAKFGSQGARPADGRGGNHRVNVVTVGGAKPSCAFCQGGHFVDLCDKLRFKPYSERKAFVSDERLCFGCLQPGHQARFCRSRITCRICGSRHASLLHRAAAPESVSRAEPVSSPPREGGSPRVVSAGVGVKPMSRGSTTMMPIVPVRLIGKGGKEVLTNAFLDQGSSGSFVTSRLASRLGLEKEDVTIRIDTVSSKGQEVSSSVVKGVRIGPVASDESYDMPPLFTLDAIPVTLEDRCLDEDLEQWEHLVGLPIHELDAPVEVMIGSNTAYLLTAQEVRSPPKGQGPVGVMTCLGWYVIGPRRPGADGDPRCLVNFLRVSEPRASTPSDLTDMFQSLYEEEFRGVSDESEEFSVNDREWMKEVSASIRKDEEGHFEVALPKVDVGKVPDSLPSAKRRLESLRKRFRRDPEYFESYRAVIKSLSEDGYAVKVPDDESDRQPVWYIPHHGVQEPKGKLRVVFDCAARSDGICLNGMSPGERPHAVET